MAENPSNEAILEQLKHGLAEFKLSSSPAPPVFSCGTRRTPSSALIQSDTSPRFFARMGPPIGGGSPALKKAERYSIQKVTGDGRCLFRALVKGMALSKGISLSSREERENADELRMAVKEFICDGDKDRLQYEEALIAITVEESLKRYCQRIGRPDFWGGESELLCMLTMEDSLMVHLVIHASNRYADRRSPCEAATCRPLMDKLGYEYVRTGVLSKLCCQPITVYIPEHEHGGRGYGLFLLPSMELSFVKVLGKESLGKS